jgi:hypothetical protein
MKKKILIACASMLAIIVLCFGLLLWKINPILSSLKPEITKLASDAIKHPITLGEISANLFPSISLEISDFEIENKTGNTEKDAKIGKLIISSSISELLSGRISVKNINLIDATLNVSLDKNGNLILGDAAIPSTSKATNKKSSPNQNVPKTKKDSKTLSLAIEEIIVKNLNLSFIDKGTKTPAPLVISNLNAQLSVVQEGNKLQIVSEIGDSDSDISYGKLFSKPQGVDFTIKGNTSISPQLISDPGLKFKIGSSNLTIPLEIKNGKEIITEIKTEGANLKDLIALSPEKKPAEIKGSVSTDIKVNLNLANKESSTPKLTGWVKITNGDVALKDPLLIFKPLNIDLKFSGSKISVSPLTTTIESGQLTANAEVNLAKPVPFKLNLKGQGVELENIVNALLTSTKIGFAGTLSQLNLSANGEKENLKSSLNSEFSAEVGKGVIKGVNIFASLLEELNGIPGIDEKISKYVPAQYQQLIKSPDTEFDALKLNSKIANQNISVNEISLVHSLYKIQGNGVADFNGQAKLNVAFHLGSEFSQQLIAKNEKLKILSDPDGTIVIPATISKSGSKVIVIPDLTAIIKRATKNNAQDAIGRALDKNLGKGSKDLLNSIFN